MSVVDPGIQDRHGEPHSWESAGHGEWLEQPDVTATGGHGLIRVDARLSAPNPCQSLSAELDRSDVGAILRVRIERRDESCVAVIGTFQYEAVMEELPAGEYHVEVVHEYPGTGWPSGTVHEESVIVR